LAAGDPLLDEVWPSRSAATFGVLAIPDFAQTVVRMSNNYKRVIRMIELDLAPEERWLTV
jgi:hypothetical protein